MDSFIHSRFQQPVFDIMWIKREDEETLGYDAASIPPHPHELRLHVSDWWKWMTNTDSVPTSVERAHYIATNGFLFLSRSENRC